MSDFKSTKEIYEYLISGGVIETNTSNNEIIKINERGMVAEKDKYGNWQEKAWSFNCFSMWSKYIEEKPKKKYWRWDIEDSEGVVSKSPTYVDDDGITTSGRRSGYYKLLKKFENEFIEV